MPFRSLRMQPSDYGRQRLWASAAYGIMGPIAGACIQRFGLGQSVHHEEASRA